MLNSRISRPVQATFTRPSNATLYTVGDVVGPVTTPANMTFDPCVQQPGWGGRITGAILHKSDHDLTGADFDLNIFHTAPVAIADNSEWLATDAEMLNFVGLAVFLAADGTAVGGASATGNFWQKTNLDITFACASGSTSLYGVLVARGAYTPASAEVIAVTLLIERD